MWDKWLTVAFVLILAIGTFITWRRVSRGHGARTRVSLDLGNPSPRRPSEKK